MRTIGTAERRARLARRHHLWRPAADASTVAADLAGLHSSDPSTVFLSAWTRVRGFDAASLERTLYDERTLVRMLGMRRTLFVVTLEQAAAMDAACTKGLVAGERRRLLGMLRDQVSDEPEAWLDDVRERTYAALAARGEASAREVTTDVPELATQLRFGEDRTWGGTMGVSTRVLFLLATEGRIVRARPLGGWTSGQYRWATTAAWLGRELPPSPVEEAAAALLRRWLRSFGPATLTDVRWWTGWTVARVKAGLAAVDAVEVSLEEGTGYVLPDDLEPVRAAGRWVALLPGLDPTVMGWKERDWYLGPHAAALFDRNGNAGPTVWADGRVVGGWRQTDGGVQVRLLEAVDARAEAAIEASRERLQTWLGDVRIRPRFPSPIDRDP